MTPATNAPPRRPHRRRPDRLHTLGAGVVAVLAVLAGILVVNLLNGPSDADGSTTQVAAPTHSARPGTDQAGGGRTTPAPSPHRAAATSPAPGPGATKTAPASLEPTPAPSASTATKPPAPPGPKATAPVVVLNNSRVAGLAEVAAKQVESAGFRVERVGNYQSIYNVPVTTVFYDDDDAARALKEAMPGIESIVPQSKTRIVSTDALILVITRDFPARPEK
ncbi:MULTISPECIES: LytR C-terminal domain-containing protein [unclassified Frankia]